MKSNPTIGLALSGGGIRGVAHLGVLKALEERNIPISQIAGVSAGSIVGALYASGYTVDEILVMIKKVSAFRLLQPALSFKGLLKVDVIKKFLRQYIKEDDLGMPFDLWLNFIWVCLQQDLLFLNSKKK